MRKYDMHMHKTRPGSDPAALISRLEEAGLFGSNVISLPPTQSPITGQGLEYEERVTDLLRFTAAYPGRLFPILWIHPDEDGAPEKVADAVSRGVMGFKMICNNYYAYEDKCLRVLEQIAATGKPVMFHSGILWDGRVSAKYNRPINWEICLEVPKLRFSLAHCSWPWYDEAIALYGKFLSAYGLRPDLSAEMFLDLTPGTPEIYRRDLLTKLHTVGYDIQHNLMFGVDCRAEDYHSDWASNWMRIDDAIYDELGLSEDAREHIYGLNLLRFLGVSDEQVCLKPKTPDEK